MADTPIVARDLERARRFYAAATRPLGLDLLDWRNGFIIGAPGQDEPVARVRCGEALSAAQPPVTLEARDDYSVRAFYRAALEAGGRQVVYPAPQATGDGHSCYAARVEDPDGNLIECRWRH